MDLSSPFVGQAFQPAGGVERPPHREGKERRTFIEVTHLNFQLMALYSRPRLQAIQVVSLTKV